MFCVCANDSDRNVRAGKERKNRRLFFFEIADTPELRARGLQGRTELPDGTGMYFVFNPPRIVAMWMKDTYIPLDMLFLDEKGYVVQIKENAVPLDETLIPSLLPVSGVIELPAGSVKKHKIELLDRFFPKEN